MDVIKNSITDIEFMEGTSFMLVTLIFEIFFGIVVIKFIINVIRKSVNNSYFKNNVVRNTYHSDEKSGKKIYERDYIDVTKDKLEIFNTDDINSLKDYFYDLFLNFENSYNNLDYNMMKILCTKQMYDNYYTGLSLDIKSGKKKIVSDIVRDKVILYNIYKATMYQTVFLMIEVTYITYTIKNGNIISGSREIPITEKFEVAFRKDYDKKDVNKCPNCGASVTGYTCEYCRTTVKGAEYRINSIKKIIE